MGDILKMDDEPNRFLFYIDTCILGWIYFAGRLLGKANLRHGITDMLDPATCFLFVREGHVFVFASLSSPSDSGLDDGPSLSKGDWLVGRILVQLLAVHVNLRCKDGLSCRDWAVSFLRSILPSYIASYGSLYILMSSLAEEELVFR